MGACGFLLPSLEYAFDEGVYIQQARLIASGARPYVDFFSHQTPLYPLTLALPAAFDAESAFLYRLPSLVAFGLCGVLVQRIAGRLMSRSGALLAMVLFYTAPLQFYGLLALPYALMLLTSTLGLHLVWFSGTRRGVVLGALSFALSILYKPIAIAAALAVGLALLADSTRRWALPWACATGAVSLGAAGLALDAYSEGAFSALVAFQGERHATGGGFDLLAQFPHVGGTLERQGIDSSAEWNLREHTQLFFSAAGRVPFLPLLLLAAGGQALAWTRAAGAAAPHRLMLTLAWAVPLVFSVLVWEPTFQSYFVQYLPAWSILGASFVVGVHERLGAAVPVRAAAVALTATAVCVGSWHVATRRMDLALLPERQPAGTTWLLFDPFLNFVTGTEPGCGVIDPFNVYGERSLTALDAAARWDAFHVGREALIECLERHPETLVGLGYWASWFVDEPLSVYLRGLPRARFVPMRLHFRSAAPGQPESGARIPRW